MSHLKERASGLPRRPGTYLFRDARGRVLYVGKAKDLRHRVASYYQAGRDPGPKTAVMLKQARDLEYIVTDSEPEALLLEMNLIKEHRPRYNIRLRDDKKYPFIKVTLNEPLPRAYPTRRVVEDGGRYFGPYTDAKAMRQTLRALQRVFGIRSCHLRLPKQRRERACLDYYIGRCIAPCVPHCTDEEYARQVKGMCDFLEGRGDALERELELRMREAAEGRRYEEAARHRDRLRALERVRVRQKAAGPDGVDRDVVAVAERRDQAVATVLRVRAGRMNGQSHFHLTPGVEGGGEALVSGFLREYYRLAPAVPAEILVEHRPADAAPLAEWLAGRRGASVRILRPQRGEKAALLRLAAENARLKLDESAEVDGGAPGLEELQEIVGMESLPLRIECVDISTSHGREPVGSLVVFMEGRPAKAEYRRFRVAARGEADDPAMMAEVVGRRFRRVRDEERPRADLLVVDGGRTQLAAARRVLDELGFNDLPLIALAKREEEIYFEGRAEPLDLQPDSEALKVLVRLRDEAHRFAITYHRKLRGRRSLGSKLDAVPGLGPTRREALLRALGSVRRIRDASAEELQRVPGIGPALAGQVLRALREEES